MPQQGLASFIVTYIEGRRQPKLEAFDKDAQKKLAAATEAEQGVLQQQLAQERRDLEQRYEVRAWLTDAAARRANQSGYPCRQIHPQRCQRQQRIRPGGRR